MAIDNFFSGDVIVQGTLSPDEFIPPAGSIDDDAVAPSANIAATKIIHRQPIKYDQSSGAAVVAATVPMHIAFGAGTAVDLIATPITAPTGADGYTIDLQKSTGGGAFATVLTGVLTIDNTSVNLTPESASIDSTKEAYSANDVFQIVIAIPVSNTTGLDVIIELYLEEQP